MHNIIPLFPGRQDEWSQLPIVALITNAPGTLYPIALSTVTGKSFESACLANQFAPLLSRLIVENADVNLRSSFTFTAEGGEMVGVMMFDDYHLSFNKPETIPELDDVETAIMQFNERLDKLALREHTDSSIRKVVSAFRPFIWSARTVDIKSQDGACFYMLFKSGMVIRINKMESDNASN